MADMRASCAARDERAASWARASGLRSSGLRRRGNRPGACVRQAEARGVRLGQASNGPRLGNQEGGEGMECWNEGGKEGWAFGPNERGEVFIFFFFSKSFSISKFYFLS